MTTQPPSTTAAAPSWRRRGPARLRLVPPDEASRQAVKALGVAAVGEPVLIGLAPADARHHMHVPGPTGTGKTTLLLNLAIADARAGRGLAVFDPKGDLVRDLLARLPASVAGRLVLIDPDEKAAPVALNLFDLAADPEQVADQLVGVMAKVWAQYWGPRTDDLARHAVLTLAHVPGATLADLPVLLADAGYRRRVLNAVRRRVGPVDSAGLVSFWAWYDSLTPAQAAVQVGPLLSKLRAVLSRRFAAELFGTAASTVRLREVLDGGILLVRLPPSLGDDTVRLVGSLLLAALLHAASPAPTCPKPHGWMRRWSWTRRTRSCTCRSAWMTRWLRPGGCGWVWCWPTSTSGNCPRAWRRRSTRTPVTRCSSPSHRRTRATWPTTSRRTSVRRT
jgi:hypothetical protein